MGWVVCWVWGLGLGMEVDVHIRVSWKNWGWSPFVRQGGGVQMIAPEINHRFNGPWLRDGKSCM